MISSRVVPARARARSINSSSRRWFACHRAQSSLVIFLCLFFAISVVEQPNDLRDAGLDVREREEHSDHFLAVDQRFGLHPRIVARGPRDAETLFEPRLRPACPGAARTQPLCGRGSGRRDRVRRGVLRRFATGSTWSASRSPASRGRLADAQVIVQDVAAAVGLAEGEPGVRRSSQRSRGWSRHRSAGSAARSSCPCRSSHRSAAS